MIDSVRTRLTLWYSGVLAFMLVVFSIGVYLLLAHSLYQRLDADLKAAVEATKATLERVVGKEENREIITSELEELFSPEQAVAVFDYQGKLVAEKPARGGIHAQLEAVDTMPAAESLFYTTTSRNGNSGDDERRNAVRRVNVSAAQTSYFVAVSQPLEPVEEELEVMQNIFFVAVPFTIILAGVGGWFLARRGLAPVVVMSDRARRISAENLEQRLPVVNPRDELGRLAGTFNELLARLDAAFAQQRQFVADASHELRTPLYVIHTTAEVTLEKTHRDEAEYREAIGIMDEQTRRLTRIVEDMFTLARADAGSRPLQPSDFYLDELLEETIRAAGVLATRKNILMNVAAFTEAPFRGDEGLLRQMFLNLLGNAVKHTPTGGRVSVNLESKRGGYVIVIADTGTGIPAEAQPHIFKRFYRANESRSHAETSDGGGAGLGLAIAKWVAGAHDGTLELLRSDSDGSNFVVFLPVTADISTPTAQISG